MEVTNELNDICFWMIIDKNWEQLQSAGPLWNSCFTCLNVLKKYNTISIFVIEGDVNKWPCAFCSLLKNFIQVYARML